MIAAILLIVFPLAMIYAAVTDLISMTIENRVQLVLICAFPIIATATGMPGVTMTAHFLLALLCLAVTFTFFALKWMGGGDAKLIAATALWFGPTSDFVQYLLLSSLYGGALTLALLALRGHLVPATGVGFVDRLLSQETGVPYGIALGLAGLTVYSHGPWMEAAIAGLR